MKEKKENKPKKEKLSKKKSSSSKEKLGTKFIHTIKKRWLISRTNTILLIAILVAVTVLINSVMANLDLTPIDCTTTKEHTLTDESKERVKDIQDNINIYFVGFEDESTEYTLAKQYNKANSNINVEIVNVEERIDIAEKYDVSSSSYVIIVENGERSKVISSDELYTYDSSYNTINLTEEKITSAILNVTSDKIPNVYFLTGYSNYSLDETGGMYLLAQYLENEVLTYKNLNMAVNGSIPEDCDTLVITTPIKDFDGLTTNEIIKYINNGGNILWLNAAYSSKLDLPNVNKVLAEYGIDPFDEGYVYETDANKTVLGVSSCIVENLSKYTEIDENLTDVMLLNSTKININSDKQDELNVTSQSIISTGDTTYFRKDVSNTSSSTDGDKQGGFTIGGIYTKTIKNEDESEAEEENETDETEENQTKSELIIFGDNNFITDIQISSNLYPMIFQENNKDVVLNSMSYLTDKEEGISIRKDYSGTSSYTATDGQRALIMKIIFIVPIAIIALGIVVWQIRRRKK